MNKKELSKLAKKAANVRWEKERNIKTSRLFNEIDRVFDMPQIAVQEDTLISILYYLVSKYRITKR